MTYFLSLILFLLPTYLIRFHIFNLPFNLLDVLIILAFLLGLYQFFISRKLEKLEPLPPKLLIPVALFILAGVLSIFLTPDKLSALGFFKSWIILPIIFSVLVVFFVPQDKIKILLAGLLGGGTFIALQAIFQKFTNQVTSDGRVVGIYGQVLSENASPNFLALYLSPILVTALSWLVINWVEKRRINWLSILLFILSIIMFLAIIFSGSRGGILATLAGIIGIFYILLKYKIPHKIHLWHSLFGLAIMAGLIGLFFWARPDLSVPPTAGRTATSNNIRYEIWKTSFEILKQKPLLGVGLGNFQNYFSGLTKDRVNYPEFIAPHALTPHNLYLAFWLNMGILGLLSFIGLLIWYFSNFKNIEGPWQIILFAVMFSQLAYGLVDTSYFKNDLAIIFWSLIALKASLQKNERVPT